MSPSQEIGEVVRGSIFMGIGDVFSSIRVLGFDILFFFYNFLCKIKWLEKVIERIGKRGEEWHRESILSLYDYKYLYC